jgi:hypothetical protein
VLVEAVEEAEATAARFVQALGRLQAMETGFDIDLERAMERLGDQVRAHEQRPAAS